MPVSPPTAASTEAECMYLSSSAAFLIIPTTWLSSAARFSPPLSRFFLTQQTCYTCCCYRSCPVLLHIHNAESPVLWASVRSHCTKTLKKKKSLTGVDVGWCEVTRGKKKKKKELHHLAENALDTN